MGLSTDLFLSKKIDDNLLCAICHDVLENASSIRCGHTFCQGCIKPIRGNSCPTCRQTNAKKTVTPNIVLRGLIGNLEVRCVNAGNNNSSSVEPEWMGEPAAKRPRVVADIINQESSSQLVAGCTWTGKIGDLKTHEKKECQFRCITCDEPGCGFACARKDMEKHKLEAMSTHLNLKVDLKVSILNTKFDAKLSAMEHKLEGTVSAMKKIQKEASDHMLTKASTLKEAMEEEHEEMNDRMLTKAFTLETELDAKMLAMKKATETELDAKMLAMKKAMKKVQKESNYKMQMKVSTLKEELDAKLLVMKDEHKERNHQMLNMYHSNKEISDQMLNMYLCMYLSNFCRQWMVRKLDALFDFVVYRPIHTPLTTLLFGIPGPKRTLWEGGLFPLVIKFNPGNVGPPIAWFPKGFFHLSVYPCGRLSWINEERWYTYNPALSIPEILFGVQKLLEHCNPSGFVFSEAYNMYMDDQTTYKERVKEQAEKFKPESFLEMASESFPKSVGEISWWKLVDKTRGQHMQSHTIIPQSPVPEPPAEIDQVGRCKCSCCAWESLFYDARDEMRLFFGVGGGSLLLDE